MVMNVEFLGQERGAVLTLDEFLIRYIQATVAEQRALFFASSPWGGRENLGVTQVAIR